MAPRSSLVAFGVSAVVFGVALSLLFGGPYSLGFAVIAILVSAALWWLASLFGDIEMRPALQRKANLLNAMAASFAALAGILTIDHGGQKVWQAIIGAPPDQACPCPPTPPPHVWR